MLFDAENLLLLAAKESGLEDFGGGAFDHDYRKFFASLNASELLREDREQAIKQYIIRMLVNRARMQKDLVDHPEIERIEMLPPVAIVGLPRTGSSKLQRILSASSGLQSLPFWHAHMFGRIPGEPDGGVQQRLQKAKQFEQWISEVVPEFNERHPIHAEEAEEETFLYEACFRSVYFPAMLHAPEYEQWLGEIDFNVSFDYLLTQLKYLQWQFYADKPKPWLLKSPTQLGYEDELTRIFPGGLKMICPHRHPKKVVASSAATLEVFRKLFNKTPDKLKLGQASLQGFSHAMNSHMAWRERNPHIDILDIGFEDITADSVGTAEKVYDFLNIPLSEQARQSIEQWDIDNPREKHGKASYTLENYGLDEQSIDTLFADYTEHFAEYL